MWILISVLLLFFPYATGCTLSESGVTKLKAASGEAVLLPCSCTELDDRPESSSWLTNSRTASAEHLYLDVFSVDKLRSRITRFNNTAPGNLSLLLSDLTKDDQGWYVCWINSVSRFINLTIEVSERTEFSRSDYCILIATVLIIMTGAAIIVIYWGYRAYKNNVDNSKQPQSGEQKRDFPLRNPHRVKETKQQETASSTHSDLEKHDCGTDSAIKHVVPENQDEYCSMYSILPVYANVENTPDVQEYVIMRPYCSVQPDLIQNNHTTVTTTPQQSQQAVNQKEK